ncbi:YceG family protein [[Clostridium] colinum]|uniref:YceG family protein n=1 Tax=[Clostridium] colinum TaxID=36835 RepID=UPI00202427D8|nr:YceG family protein [[Clostridium] colinum]
MQFSRLYETSLNNIVNDENSFIVFYGTNIDNKNAIRDTLHTFVKNVVEIQKEYVILENTFELTDEDYSLITGNEDIEKRINVAYNILSLKENITNEEKTLVINIAKEYIIKNEINFYDKPLIVAYGSFKKEDLLFLDLVNIMGANVIVFDLEKLNINNWEKNENYTIYKGNFTYDGSIFDAIDSGVLINSKSTDCKIHNDKIINDYLDEGLYSKEQLSKFKSIGTQINASRFDILPILKEPASLRDGFKLLKNEQKVIIPCFCSLINGRHKYLEEYHNFIDEIINENTLDILLKEPAKFIIKCTDKNNLSFDINNCYNTNSDNNSITVYFDKLFDLDIYKNDDLPLVLQQNIVDTSLEIKDSLNLNIDDYKILLTNLISIDNKFKHILNARDCSGQLPRIVVIDNFNISNKHFIYFMLTLSKLGVDVIFLSTKGVFNIENYLPEYMINIITLDKYDENNNMLLTYKDVGIAKKINSIKYKILNTLKNK